MKKWILFLMLIFLIGCNAQNKITITFNSNGGDSVESNVIEKNSSIELPLINKPGYNFLGWYHNDQKVSNQTVFTSDTQLDAKWEKMIYKVTFIGFNDEILKVDNVEYQGNANPPVDPIKEGYIFTGWDKEFNNITSDINVKATFQVKTFKVSFMIDNYIYQVQNVEYEKSAIEPNNPSKTGYDFIGWDQEFNSITEERVIKALFQIKTFTVTFLLTEGQIYQIQTVEYNKNAIMPTNPVKLGYIFTGWDHTLENITQDTTVYANFQEDPKGLIYELVKDEYHVKSHDKSNVDIIIPSTYNGLKVVKIADNAFKDFYQLKSIILGENIKVIGVKAFSGCDNLTDITLNPGLELIGDAAFFNCTRLTKINITAKVIGEGAFELCSMLVDITIASTVEEIKSYAFYSCSRLLTITIPTNVRVFGDHIFSWCQKLATVYTPSDNLNFLTSELSLQIYTKFVVTPIV